MSGYCILAFSSTHSAIAAERRLKGRFPVAVMPTPRAVTASCGIALRFAPELLEAVAAELEGAAALRGSWDAYHVRADGSVSRSDPKTKV